LVDDVISVLILRRSFGFIHADLSPPSSYFPSIVS
jgi:hypothetical protein